MSRPKYPRTPMWPGSPSRNRDDRNTPDPEAYMNTILVITEKIDGTGILINQGMVKPRSTDPSNAPEPWLAMARKHHAWKTSDPRHADLLLYAEDIYAVHAIEYDPVPETETTRVFASASLATGYFHPWEETVALCADLEIPTVPVLFAGETADLESLQNKLTQMHAAPSELGPQREGMVIRRRGAYTHQTMHRFVCKSVRADHVQSTQHWTRGWRRCALRGPTRGET